MADDLYSRLEVGRVEALYDGREASPGVKFADADFTGLPLRVTVSARSRERGGAKVKRRTCADTVIVPIEGIAEHRAKVLQTIREELALLESARAKLNSISSPAHKATAP